MERSTTDRAGEVLLEVRFTRAFAGAFVVVGLGLIATCVLLASGADRGRWGGAQWSFVAFGVLLGALLAVAGLRQLRSPARLLTATDRGVLLHLEGNRYVRTGFLVPWNEIESLSLETVRGWQGDDARRFRTVALRLRSDARRVPGEMSYGPGDTSEAVHVDASSGDVRGEALLRRLQELHRRFS